MTETGKLRKISDIPQEDNYKCVDFMGGGSILSQSFICTFFVIILNPYLL